MVMFGDEDDEEDSFKHLPSKANISPPKKKASMFGDESDDDDFTMPSGPADGRRPNTIT
jgi:hypothetical protein